MSEGTHLGKYKLVRQIGDGGMAKVYLATDPNGAYVVLKVPHSSFAQDPVFRQRLHSEKDALCRLNHPCIAVFKDFHEDWDPPVLVMEYVDGKSLGELLNDRNGPWPVDRTCAILTQVAEALAYCHKSEIIHRDVKPANILITGADHVKVADFGISRLKDVPSVTHAGVVVGSAHIMAPEQWRSEPLTSKVDIYALGIIAYRMLTGRYPFEGSIAELHEAHCHQHPSQPRTLNPDLPPPLSDLVLECLNKDPRLRLSDADEFIHRLARLRPLLEFYTRYRFEEEIGRGSMGVVYRATRREDGMKVAIKTLDQRLTDPSLLSRLLMEGSVLARLNHRFICKLIEARESFLVMEYVTGETLADRIRRSSGIPVHEALAYFKDILQAVGAAHRENVIHRDLKPSNIIVTDDPIERHAIVMDFGIAKLIGSSGMTKTSEGLGALPYKAPELWQRRSPDRRSDIYALGALFHEMLAGEQAFPGPEPDDFNSQHLRGTPRPLPNAVTKHFPRLQAFIWRCLEKRSEVRFPSVEDMYDALISATTGRPSPTPPEGSGEAEPTTEFAPAPKAGNDPIGREKLAATRIWKATAVLVVAGALISLLIYWLRPFHSTSEGTISAVPPASSDSLLTDQTAANDGAISVQTEASIRQDSISQAFPQASDSGTRAAAVNDNGVSKSRLRFQVTPSGGTICFLDGTRQGNSVDAELPTGPHRIRVLNPSYPILDRTVRLGSNDTLIDVNLVDLFGARGALELRLALNPRSEDYTLHLVLNSGRHEFSSFPTELVPILTGKWRMEATLRPRPGTNGLEARIDSCVTYPYGGGPRVPLKDGRGEIDFSSTGWQGSKQVPIQVYWSAKARRAGL